MRKRSVEREEVENKEREEMNEGRKVKRKKTCERKRYGREL